MTSPLQDLKNPTFKNWILISFRTERKIIDTDQFIMIINGIYIMFNRNCPDDHIPLNLERNKNLVLRMHRKHFLISIHIIFFPVDCKTSNRIFEQGSNFPPSCFSISKNVISISASSSAFLYFIKNILRM